MDKNSTSSFTNFLNSAISSSDPQNPNNQQPHGFRPSFPMNFPPHQFPSNFHHPYYSYQQFGVPPGYQQFQSSSYQHGLPFPGNFHRGSTGPSSPVGSGAMFGGGEDSASPVTSPLAPAHNTSEDVIRVEEWSDIESDEEKTSGRMHWAEEDNLRLISAWLHNSNDPIDGNGKKGARYWKEVAVEYNAYAPKAKKRTTMQLKNHWNTNSALVMKFHGCWIDINNTYRRGYSDEQVMDMVQEEWKRVKQTEKPFPLVYWWRAVREEPKWLHRDVAADIMNKRNKVSSSGAYTSSSNRDTDDAGDTDRPRPIGQKQAKEQRKGKGKLKGKGRLSEENVGQLNNLQDKKNEAIEKMATAAREHAAAIEKMAEVDKEKVKMDKIKQLTELMMIDTKSYSETQKTRHEKILDFLSDEIYGKE